MSVNFALERFSKASTSMWTLFFFLFQFLFPIYVQANTRVVFSQPSAEQFHVRVIEKGQVTFEQTLLRSDQKAVLSAKGLVCILNPEGELLLSSSAELEEEIEIESSAPCLVDHLKAKRASIKAAKVLFSGNDNVFGILTLCGVCRVQEDSVLSVKRLYARNAELYGLIEVSSAILQDTFLKDGHLKAEHVFIQGFVQNEGEITATCVRGNSLVNHNTLVVKQHTRLPLF